MEIIIKKKKISLTIRAKERIINKFNIDEKIENWGHCRFVQPD